MSPEFFVNKLGEAVNDHRISHLFSAGQLDFHFTQHLMMLGVAAILATVLISIAARARIAGRSSRLATAVEAYIVIVRDQIVFPAMGRKYGGKYLNFFLSLSTLILTCNILGLLPGIHIPGTHISIHGAATGNFSINLGLASIVYVYGIYCATREHGLGAYLHSFLPGGVPWFLAPLIWFIEWAGMLLKHIVLAVRLTANMAAGHLVLFAILGLVMIIQDGISSVFGQIGLSSLPVLLALGIYMLECLVAFIQAGIFVILSAIFFGMAVNPHH